jgi:membrane associated rhomboid family serine protease
MTLRRLLIYPFCLFIIIFLIYNLMDGNFNGKAVFGIFIALTYLIIDLKIIFRKNKK